MTIEELKERIKQLKEQQRQLLLHMVGTTYYMDEVLIINKEIEQCQKLVKELSLKESEE